MNKSYRLFIATIPMDRLGSSVGLAGDRGMNGAVGLVNRDTDCRGIALLEHLVVTLVSNSKTQQPREYKCLKNTTELELQKAVRKTRHE